MSGIFGENLFDDWMGFPMRELANVDRRLYGKNASHIMKTDVKETDGTYELEVDLPGFKKDEINVKLEDGYMTISATKEWMVCPPALSAATPVGATTAMRL